MADEAAVFCQTLNDVDACVQLVHIADCDALAIHVIDIQHVDDFAGNIFFNASDFDLDKVLSIGCQGEVGLAD